MKSFCKTGFTGLLLFLYIPLFSQITQQKVRQYTKTNQVKLIEEYTNFLSIPNIASDSANIRRNTDFIMKMMNDRGIKAELLFGRSAGANPAVFGKVTVKNAKQTIALYAHYDGQPVNPKQWSEGLQPFHPVFITAPLERGGKIIDYKKGDAIDPSWRISGRSAADDKAGVMTILNAYDALVKSKVALNNNILFFFEGEEEEGSTHLGEIFENNKEKLQSDLWIIIDGPRHVSGKKLVSFGVRGDVNMYLTLYGPKRPLHSGNYGNWAPSPAMNLVQLLAGMKDDKGNILINGFYDDVVPLSASEKEAIAKVPNIEETLKKELGIKEPDGEGKSFLELLSLPTLNINGISSGNVGSMASNQIPAKAEAVLDLRLVKGNDVERQIQKVVKYIESKGYHVLEHEPSDEERMQYAKLIKITHSSGYNSQRTPMDVPIAKNVVKAIQSTVDYPIVLIPSSGGSLPLVVFEEKLDAKVLSVPIANYDNNQHAENENIQISYLMEGIETIAAIITMD
ncbi:MAG: M20/M25/M40 family metallo-hydrolase [Bacteroidetes bacterium]|nr:M20/M25/M40 family metallo-hydrolase [Bacteroidota bacterium]